METIELKDRYKGALLGLACGDAVGTTVEFSPRGTFPRVTDMVGGGVFRLPPGAWTDDTSMALCLASSLLEVGFDPVDQMERYLDWWLKGTWSSTGYCFDIGVTTQQALARFEKDKSNPFQGDTHYLTAGNGSLMRLAPVVLYAHFTPHKLERYVRESSCTTHGAKEAIDCCQLLAQVIQEALKGTQKGNLLDKVVFNPQAEPAVADIASGSFLLKSWNQIRGSGYSVESLEAALWCFYKTSSFEQAVLTAANFGEDADTTAAITGQIAGAYYGVGGIPPAWKRKLVRSKEIEGLADALYARSQIL